jgi:hypothetical protein
MWGSVWRKYSNTAIPTYFMERLSYLMHTHYSVEAGTAAGTEADDRTVLTVFRLGSA